MKKIIILFLLCIPLIIFASPFFRLIPPLFNERVNKPVTGEMFIGPNVELMVQTNKGLKYFGGANPHSFVPSIYFSKFISSGQLVSQARVSPGKVYLGENLYENSQSTTCKTNTQGRGGYDSVAPSQWQPIQYIYLIPEEVGSHFECVISHNSNGLINENLPNVWKRVATVGMAYDYDSGSYGFPEGTVINNKMDLIPGKSEALSEQFSEVLAIEGGYDGECMGLYFNQLPTSIKNGLISIDFEMGSYMEFEIYAGSGCTSLIPFTTDPDGWQRLYPLEILEATAENEHRIWVRPGMDDWGSAMTRLTVRVLSYENIILDSDNE